MPDQGGQRGRREGDDQRDARPVERAAEDVAPDLVDAEDVLAAGPRRGGEERVERPGVALVGAGCADQVDDERREDRQQDRARR